MMKNKQVLSYCKDFGSQAVFFGIIPDKTIFQS